MTEATAPVGGASGGLRMQGAHGPPLRVLVVPASYFAHDRTVGGGERYALEYARALSTLTPTTLALFDPEPAIERDGELEIRTFPVRHRSERFAFPFTRSAWTALGRFDVVHAMVFPTPLTDSLVLRTRLSRQALVLTDVGGGGPCLSTYLRKTTGADLYRLAEGLAPLSEHGGARFHDWRQPRTTLYGGVREGAGPVPLPSDSEPYALYVGRLLPHKGVLELIESLDQDIALRVVGRPYDTAYVERLRSASEGKRVRFLFDADDAELKAQYAGATVVLQPSLPVGEVHDTSELLGLVTLEAMAMGRAVVVTRAGSLPELVEDGVSGFVIRPHDREALGERIRRLITDRGLADRMGAESFRRAQARFTWTRAAERGLALYRRIRTASIRDGGR